MFFRKSCRSESPRKNRRKTVRSTPPLYEQLETRLALATLLSGTKVSFTDVDGDVVTVSSSKPIFQSSTVNQVFRFDNGSVNGSNSSRQQLLEIDLRPIGSPASGIDLKVSAKRSGSGDGKVNVGAISAQSIDLKSVTIAGDLGRIRVGDSNASTAALGTLSLLSMGWFGNSTQAPGGSLVSTFAGSLNNLVVESNLKNAKLFVQNGGSLAKLTIGGSLIGGVSDSSGLISVAGNILSAKVGGSIQGGAGENSGSIQSGGTINKIFVSQGLIGSSGKNSGTLSGVKGINQVTVQGDVRGGSGVDSGRIFSEQGLTSVSIGGSLIGGSGQDSGGVESLGQINQIVIWGDMKGVAITAPTASFKSAYILGEQLGKVTVRGSLYSSTLTGANSTSSKQPVFSGAILAEHDIGSIKVWGSLVGNSKLPVYILAGGSANPSASSDQAIGRLTVGGNVQWSEIIVGVDTNKNGVNADAQIGTITIGGDWTGSSVAAGAYTASGDFGAGADVRFNGSGVKDLAGLYSAIGSMRIGGQILNSQTNRHFGTVAEWISSVSIGGKTVSLTPGHANDNLSVGPGNTFTFNEKLLTTAPPTTGETQWGQSLQFDAVQQPSQAGTSKQPLLELPDLFLDMNSVTFAAWFQTFGSGVLLNSSAKNSLNQQQTIFNPLVYINETGNLVAGLYDPTPLNFVTSPTNPTIISSLPVQVGGATPTPVIGAPNPLTSSNLVNDGNWHHVAFVASHTSQSLYLDGMLVGTSTPQYRQVNTGLTTNGSVQITLDRAPAPNQVVTGSVWQQNVDGQNNNNVTAIANYQFTLDANGNAGQFIIQDVYQNLGLSSAHTTVTGASYNAGKITFSLAGPTITSTTPLTVYSNYLIPNGKFFVVPLNGPWMPSSDYFVGGTIELEDSSNPYPPVNYPQGFVGAVDEVAIWQTALTQAQIQSAMSGPLSSQPALLGNDLDEYFDFDGNLESSTFAFANWLPPGAPLVFDSSSVPVDPFSDLPRLPGYQNWGINLMTPLASSSIALQPNLPVSYVASLMANDQLLLQLPSSPSGTLTATFEDAFGNSETSTLNPGERTSLSFQQTGAAKLTFNWVPVNPNSITSLTYTALPGMLNSLPGLMSTFTTPTSTGPVVTYSYADPSIPGILTPTQIANDAAPANYWPLWTDQSYFPGTSSYSAADLAAAYQNLVLGSALAGGPTDFCNINSQLYTNPIDYNNYLAIGYYTRYGINPPVSPPGNLPFPVKAEATPQDAVYKFLYNANLTRTTIYQFVNGGGTTSANLRSWVQSVINSITTGTLIPNTVADTIDYGQTGQETASVTIDTPSSKQSQGRLWANSCAWILLGATTGGVGLAGASELKDETKGLGNALKWAFGVQTAATPIAQMYISNAIASGPSSTTYNVDISQITNGTLSYLNLDKMAASINASMQQIWNSTYNSLDDSFLQKVMSNFGLLKALSSISAKPLGDPSIADPSEAVNQHLTNAAWSQMIPAAFNWESLPVTGYPTADGHASNPGGFNVANANSPITLPPPSSTTTAPNGAYDVATGDFDGDGDQDFVVTNSGTNNFTVGLNDGTGNFSNLNTYWIPSGSTSPEGVEVADFDRDGNLDIIIAIHGTGSGARIYWGDGSGGNWTNSTGVGFSSGPQGLAIADFDQDGHPDFAAANNSSQNVLIYRYSGSRGFTYKAAIGSVGSLPARLATTTYGGNTYLAVAASDYWRAYKVTTAFNYNQVGYGGGNNIFGIAFGNFDWAGNFGSSGYTTEDLMPDMVVSMANYIYTVFGELDGSGYLTWSWATTSSSSYRSLDSSTPQGMTSFSVPGDPRSYYVVADSQKSVLRMGYGPYTSNSTNSQMNEINMQGATGMNEAAAADFNGDGIPELISANNGSGNVSIVQITGTQQVINRFPGSAAVITTYEQGLGGGSVSGGTAALSSLLTYDQVQDAIARVTLLQQGNPVFMPSGYQVRTPGTFVTVNAATNNGTPGSYLTAWNLYDNSGNPIALNTAQQLFGVLETGEEVQPANPNNPLAAYNGAWFMPTVTVAGAATTWAEAFFVWGKTSPGYNNYGNPVPGNSLSLNFYPVTDLPPDLTDATGLVADGTSFSQQGGVDRAGNAYSANQVGESITWNGSTFVMGQLGAPNLTRSYGQSILFVPDSSDRKVNLLGACSNGSRTVDFILNFTDGSSVPYKQTMSDWAATSTSNSGEQLVKTCAKYNLYNGTQGSASRTIFGYSFEVPSGKTLRSITLPDDQNVFFLGIQPAA